MSEFEAACFNWYCTSVNQFTMESGILPELFKEIGLRGRALRLFLRAANLIYQAFAHVSAEKARKDAEGHRR